MTRFILALDQGTTSSRAIVFRDDGTIVGVGQREFGQLFPQPGWVEHDPEEIWRSQIVAAKDAIAGAGVAPGDISTLGIANQRETVVLWERETLRPLANAIVWQDRRTAEACERLRADGLEGLIRARTGLVIDAYFSAPKVAWLLDNLAGARERAERGELAAGTIDTWLIARLTNGTVHATDRTNASRWMVFDIDRGAWDADLLAALRIPGAVLPEVRPSAGEFGRCAPEHLGAALPIAGVAGDQQASLFGQVCVRPGMAKNTYGTGCFLLLVTDGRPKEDTAGLITTLTAAPPGGDAAYALEGSIFVAGAAVQWLRDGLGLIRTAAESEPVARSVTSSEGVYVVPAFVGLGAPHWDMYARGTVVGLTRGTGRAQLVRATLESIAYQTRDVVEAMEGVSGVALAELRVDGGAATNDLLMQMQADILGQTVVRPAVTETTALGAAALAGLAAGVWASLPELEARWRVDRRFEPAMLAAEREAAYVGWRRAVDRARGWLDG